MTDEAKALVERLRKARVWPDYSQSRVTIETAHQAADTIEAQAREIARLREALEIIAAECCIPVGTDKQMYARWRKLATKRVDVARAALEGTSHDA